MTLSLGKWWAVGNLSVKPSATKPTTNVSNKMRMKMESSRRSLILASAGCIMALAFTPAASAATILTFRDGTGAALPDDQSVPAAYGDNVAASPQAGFSYGQAGSGYTPNITTAYGATARTFTGGYGDLATILYNREGPSYTITFTAGGGFLVNLESFNVAGFGGNETFDFTVSNGVSVPFTLTNVLAPGVGHTNVDFTGQEAAS